jgi:hypothetical protein
MERDHCFARAAAATAASPRRHHTRQRARMATAAHCSTGARAARAPERGTGWPQPRKPTTMTTIHNGKRVTVSNQSYWHGQKSMPGALVTRAGAVSRPIRQRPLSVTAPSKLNCFETFEYNPSYHCATGKTNLPRPFAHSFPQTKSMATIVLGQRQHRRLYPIL